MSNEKRPEPEHVLVLPLGLPASLYHRLETLAAIRRVRPEELIRTALTDYVVAQAKNGT